MQAVSPWVELRRRGVLGALAAYVVVVAGALQLADVVSHGLDLPSWTMKLMIWLSVAGLPVVGVISWFYDLTKAGLVRTEAPRERVVGGSPPLVQMPSPVQGQTPQQTPGGSKPMDGAALNADSAPLAGRYRIERELGSGGMGRVLSAHDEKLGRRVAIKVLTGAHDAGRLARFSQEARAAGALEHPNVVAVYDLGEHEGAPFLVTELLDGATLREVVNKGPLEPEIARKLAVQLARGLEAAHARGVVHRDLKPENLFLTRDGRLKILDFGLAKLTGPTEEPRGPGLTATGAIFGTPGYLAPEQAKGLSSDSRADIFAVGAVLYELLSGRRAFPGSTLVEAGHAALTQEPPPYGRAIPQDLARIVARCLEKDPAKRFADGAELVKALERVELAVLAGMDAQAIEGPSLSERWAGLPQWFKNALYVVVILGVGSALLDLRPSARNRAAQKKWEQQERENAMREGRMTPVQPMSPVSPVAPMAPTPPMMGTRGGTRGTPIPTPRPMPSPHAMPTPPTAHEEERGLDDDTPPDADAELDKAQAELEKQAVKLPQLKAVQEQIKAAIASQKLNKLTSRSGVLTGAHSLAMAGQFDEADRLLRQQAARDPEDVYTQLHLAALHRRMGRGGAIEELRAFLEKIDDDEWPGSIAQFYVGALPEQALFALTADEDDETKQKSELCEANFYVGLFYATATPPDVKRARSFFEKARTADTNDIERSLADAELRQLQRPAIEIVQGDPRVEARAQAEAERQALREQRAQEKKAREAERMAAKVKAAQEKAKAKEPAPSE